MITCWSHEGLLRRVRKALEPVASVVDLGCGIRPHDQLQARRLVAVDVFRPYLDRAGPGWRRVCADLRAPLPFADGAFDVATAWDVIEHLERDQALGLIDEALRVARKGLVIGTPLGYQEQEGDAWGLGGIEWQKHRSGWLPEDFPDAEVVWMIPPDPTEWNSWYHHGWWAAWIT